jgi:hypothetical protein
MGLMTLGVSRALAEQAAAVDLADRVRAGAEWLARIQREDGTFRYGWDPALDIDQQPGNLIRQAGASAVLARSARLLKDRPLESAALRAIRSLASLAEDRRPPMEGYHPVGFSSLLLLAIRELPAIPDDLKRVESRLSAKLRARQRGDGSIRLSGGDDPADDEGDPEEWMAYYPGEALAALSAGPAEDRESTRRSLAFYRGYWAKNPEPAAVPWQTMAFARLATDGKDPATAYVFAMNDRLVELQYAPGDREAAWVGGFASFVDGRRVRSEPDITTGSYAEALVEAWLLARRVGDADRAQQYGEALRRALVFLSRLQYRAEDVEHFSPAYRPQLIGSFHASLSNGTVRIDFTQHALMAMSRAWEVGWPTDEGP